MKIQCDVCEEAEALLLCTADEAALCVACDHRVHHANKLASKHQRFSLLAPSSNHSQLCDICRERRALLFCQQDRAILCRECDLLIHMANELTKKHDRFLLTGCKLSATSAVNMASASASASGVSGISDLSGKRPMSSGSSDNIVSNQAFKMSGLRSSGLKVNEDVNCQLPTEGGGSTSSISEYLIDTLPGWHVEEFLESSAPFGLCKDNEFRAPAASSTGLSEIWLPKARQKANSSQFSSQVIGPKDSKKASSINSKKRWSDDGFTVPQVSPQSIGKRLRTIW